MKPQVLIPMMLLIPLLGGLLMPLAPRGGKQNVKLFAFLNTLATFGVSLWLAWSYDWSNTAGEQFSLSAPWVGSFGLRFGMGIIDSISLWLVLLTTFLMPLVALGSFSALSGKLVEREKEFYFWLLVLETAMLGTFVATDAIFFYICFEFTLVPLYFLIGVFGSNLRLKASRVFFLYTFTGSMLTLAGVLYVAWWNSTPGGNWSFDIRTLCEAAQRMNPRQQTWVLLAMLAGFAVKVPLWPVHTWLPLAHTEAPTAGSVILAGVLLKLGTYGLLRLGLPMAPNAFLEWSPVIGALAVTGILYTALICWVQTDIKKLIAYSSVSHLGYCVLGMAALNTIGVSGSVMYMINHGLSTGALFLCVGMIYERFHTRQMDEMSGLARGLPVWGTFFVFFCLASVGLPGLNGFVGEFLSLLGAFRSSQALGGGSPEKAVVLTVAAGVGMILGAIYLLYMVGKVVFGPLKYPEEGHGHGHGRRAVKDLSFREIVTLLPLAASCLWLGMLPGTMLRTLEDPIEKLTAPTMRILSIPVAGGQKKDGGQGEIRTAGSISLRVDHSQRVWKGSNIGKNDANWLKFCRSDRSLTVAARSEKDFPNTLSQAGNDSLVSLPPVNKEVNTGAQR